jgi:hypothetical protein
MNEPESEPKAGQERKWRRRSLWALLVLLPATLVETSWGSVEALLSQHDLIARDVAWGSKAQFGGSDWQLKDLQAALGMKKLPENAVPVLADFTVAVRETNLQDLWLDCRIMLIDAAGRRWTPTSAVSLRAPDDVMTCNSAIFSGAKAGDTLTIRATFLVPKDATATVRPAVGLGSERPYYLLFQRPQNSE